MTHTHKLGNVSLLSDFEPSNKHWLIKVTVPCRYERTPTIVLICFLQVIGFSWFSHLRIAAINIYHAVPSSRTNCHGSGRGPQGHSAVPSCQRSMVRSTHALSLVSVHFALCTEKPQRRCSGGCQGGSSVCAARSDFFWEI